MLLETRGSERSSANFSAGNRNLFRAIWKEMANNSGNQKTTSDRRDAIHQGSSLSGSTKRDNDATEKALHPPTQGAESGRGNEQSGMSESGVIARSPEKETVDQDPGERQKENQNQSKDDPLAA